MFVVLRIALSLLSGSLRIEGLATSDSAREIKRVFLRSFGSPEISREPRILTAVKNAGLFSLAVVRSEIVRLRVYILPAIGSPVNIDERGRLRFRARLADGNYSLLSTHPRSLAQFPSIGPIVTSLSLSRAHRSSRRRERKYPLHGNAHRRWFTERTRDGAHESLEVSIGAQTTIAAGDSRQRLA